MIQFWKRIERGLIKIVSTHTVLLTLFVMMFCYIFRKQKPLDELIEAGMIVDPMSIADPLIKLFIGYLPEILLILIGVPVISMLFVMVYNRLLDHRQTHLTAALLDNK